MEAGEATYERLAYEAAQRALDKQERLLEEHEGLYAVRDDLAEVYRRLAYNLDRFWDDNDAEMQKLFISFRVAAGALSAEILVLIATVSDSLF